MDELDQLGSFAGEDADDWLRENRSSLIALAAATGLGTLAVVVTVWVISLAGASPAGGVRGAPTGDSIVGALSTGTASGDATATDDASADDPTSIRFATDVPM